MGHSTWQRVYRAQLTSKQLVLLQSCCSISMRKRNHTERVLIQQSIQRISSITGGHNTTTMAWAWWHTQRIPELVCNTVYCEDTSCYTDKQEDDVSSRFIKWKETSSTSPSRMLLGHYKAIIKDSLLLKYLTQALHVTVKSGLTLRRWCNAVILNTMLPQQTPTILCRRCYVRRYSQSKHKWSDKEYRHDRVWKGL